MSAEAEVVVVGAGHAGLAVATALSRRGIRSVVLEREACVGVPWRRRYPALRLNTERWGSNLPGLRMGAGAERWPSGAEFADYLAAYAARHVIDIRFGVAVTRVDVTPGGCRLRTSAGDLDAPFVVLTTGPDREPLQPTWPGIERWAGGLLHAIDYREPGMHRGQAVLVVGGGESGADIAVDLARAGASNVTLSVRTPPYVQRPDVLGVPAQALAIMARHQPPALFDAMATLMRWLTVGDLSAHGLGRPPSLHRSARVRGKAPILDRGFVRLVEAGLIAIRPAVAAMTAHEVRLADGTALRPDTVILATGYRPGLEPLVGHLGVLRPDGRPLVAGPRAHAHAPNLLFAGYTPVLSGNIREAGPTASRIAREIRRRLRRHHPREVIRP